MAGPRINDYAPAASSGDSSKHLRTAEVQQDGNCSGQRYSPQIRVPHLRDSLIVAKVGIVRSATVFSSYRPYAQKLQARKLPKSPFSKKFDGKRLFSPVHR
jgi:hypothetical protein